MALANGFNSDTVYIFDHLVFEHIEASCKRVFNRIEITNKRNLKNVGFVTFFYFINIALKYTFRFVDEREARG